MRHHCSDTHQIAEDAAAIRATAEASPEVVRGRKVGVVLSGGNVDRAIYREVLAEAD
jgi:threonine dehydratase